jgi:hypothetical protein
MQYGIPENVIKSAEITANAWGHAYIFMACEGQGLAAPSPAMYFVRKSSFANQYDQPGRNVRLMAEIKY